MKGYKDKTELIEEIKKSSFFTTRNSMILKKTKKIG